MIGKNLKKKIYICETLFYTPETKTIYKSTNTSVKKNKPSLSYPYPYHL